MRYILFRGKPTREVLENESLLKTLPIKDGFVYGNLIYNDKQPYIVGPIYGPDPYNLINTSNVFHKSPL